MAVMQWVRRLMMAVVAVGSMLATTTVLAAETIPSCTVAGNTVSCGVQAVQPAQILTVLNTLVTIATAAGGILMVFNLIKIVLQLQNVGERESPEVMHRLYRFIGGAVLFFGATAFFGLTKGVALLF